MSPNPIDHIAFDPPVVGTLTASARRGLRDQTGATIPVSIWINGVAYPSRADVSVRQPLKGCLGTPCPAIDCMPNPVSPVEAKAFPIRISAISGCTSLDTTDHAAVVGQVLDRDRSAQLAEYLWTGIAGTVAAVPFPVPNQVSLLGEATEIAGGPHPVIKGIALLDRAMRAAGYRGPLTIHGVSALQYQLSEVFTVAANVWRHGDTTAILDPGYPGTAPVSAPVAGTTWIIATGPVEFDVAEVKVEDLTETHQIDCFLESGARALQFGIVRFPVWPAPLAIQVSL